MLAQAKEKYQEVLQVAEKLSRQNPDWVTFFREVLGIDGIVRQAFPSHEDLAEFEKSEEYERIQQVLVKLREKRASAAEADNEPTRVITVRLPKSMHEYLRTEAHDLRTSMNKLCISKLLQVIAEDKIPNDRSSSSPQRPAAPAASTATTGQTLGAQPLGGQPHSGQSGSQFGGQPGGQQPGGFGNGQQQPTTPPFKPTQPRF